MVQIQRILCPVDFYPASERAVDYAVIQGAAANDRQEGKNRDGSACNLTHPRHYRFFRGDIRGDSLRFLDCAGVPSPYFSPACPRERRSGHQRTIS
jgi:hypothetical protein